MTTRADRLQAYVDATRGAPVIGHDDCGPWAVRWVEQETGARLNMPAYASREAGYRMVARAGGIVAFANALLAPFGLFETRSPELGDVGVIALSDRELAVIFCRAGLAAIRDEQRGIRFLRPARVLKAWSLP